MNCARESIGDREGRVHEWDRRRAATPEQRERQIVLGLRRHDSPKVSRVKPLRECVGQSVNPRSLGHGSLNQEGLRPIHSVANGDSQVAQKESEDSSGYHKR
jgi:hypothetical protein